MWIVIEDRPYEQYITKFDTKERALEYYNKEIAHRNDTMQYLDEYLYVNEYSIYLAKVNDTTKLKY